MAKPKNAFLSNSFLIFITRFFPSLANLAVLIWYSRNLPTSAYGHYQFFWIQLNVLYPIACFGIHILVVTYAPDALVRIVRKLTKKHFIGYSVWLLVLASVFAYFQNRMLHLPFLIPFIYILCFSLSMIFESLLIVFRDFKSLVTLSILYAAAFWLAHWYVLKDGFSLRSIFFLLLVITFIRLCIYMGISLTEIKRLQPVAGEGEMPMAETRSLWLHLGLYDVLQVLFSWIDKFVISLVCAADVSAIYFNGSQNIPFLPLLTSAAGSAVLIQLAHGHEKDEKTDAVILMNRTGRVLSCIVFPVFFFLFLFRQELILLLGMRFAPAIPVFMVSILVLPVRAYSFTTVLQRLHKGRIINAGAIADLLLACALMYPLYEWLGLPGVALSFVVSTYLQASFYLIYTARLLHVSPFKLLPVINWIIKFIVFATLFIIIHYWSYRCFTGLITLFLSLGATVGIIGASLLIEFKNQKKYVGS